MTTDTGSDAALAAEVATPPRSRERRLQIVAFAGLAAYLLLTHLAMGLRAEHGVLAGVAFVVAAVGGRALRFLGLFLPVIITGISYDYFRLAVPLRGEIHVADIYQAELALFGIDGQVPALWFEAHTHPAVDLVTGASYMVYMYVPIGLSVVLYFIDKERMLLVGLAFFFTNLLGMVVYLAFPAAPPWYVADYGLGPADLSALPNAAGTLRFDQLLGIDYFQTFYQRSANVFGAVPSLHVAYPASTALALVGMGKRWWLSVAIFTAVVAFAAVYLQHHYILDLIAGAACAGAGFLVARRVITALRRPRPELSDA